MVSISHALRFHLQWWRQKEVFFQGIPLASHQNQFPIWTDAGNSGWGGHSFQEKVSGLWNRFERQKHINWLELMAVFKVLKLFVHNIQQRNVLVHTDNSTVVAYINKQGGSHSPELCFLVWEIHLFAAHIPGQRNVLAGNLSRGRKIQTTEWSLDRGIVQRIFFRLGYPNIDLFATFQNAQLPVFCSPFNFVDRHVGLCIPSSCVSPKGTVQSQVRGLCTYSNSTMVPETVLVSSTPGSVDRPAIQASDLQGSVISEQRPVSSQLPRSIKFGGVENFKQSRLKKKFSSSASRFIEGARRPSTRRLYDSRISAFREWCKSKKISAGSVSVEKIADFFVHLHKTKGCQYNTIMGYRSAIASFHKGFVDSRDGTVSTNPDLSKLIKGILMRHLHVGTLFQTGIYLRFFGNCVILLLNPYLHQS
ncbi:hypothetical protein SNE40_019407 [Patella caerulea]|uniref:Core-binding (CB) domain-containing protein n=1 Tax=Patella caerulea TaxID=87958 RepID=A0AAN8J839_PATCE